mgnify:FL=1
MQTLLQGAHGYDATQHRTENADNLSRQPRIAAMTPDVDQSKARWIRTSVEMLDHPVFDGAEYCPRSAWLWLIANAAWKQRRFKPAKSNVILTLERGQVPVGREYLAKIWGWSEKKVRNFLALLQSENMIEMGQPVK